MKDLINPKYYNFDTWLAWFTENQNEEKCKHKCLNNASCIYAIYFYQNQVNLTINETFNRKPVSVSANTCFFQNKLIIQSGTLKDTSSNIFFLTSMKISFCLFIL